MDTSQQAREQNIYFDSYSENPSLLLAIKHLNPY